MVTISPNLIYMEVFLNLSSSGYLRARRERETAAGETQKRRGKMCRGSNMFSKAKFKSEWLFAPVKMILGGGHA